MSQLAHYYDTANALYLRIEKGGTALTEDIGELKMQFCVAVAFWMAELGQFEPYDAHTALMKTTNGGMFEKCRCAMYS